MLKKTLCINSRSANEPDLAIKKELNGEFLYTKDVVSALKKFKKYWESYNSGDFENYDQICFLCNDEMGYYESCAFYKNKFFCFNCWFKECFGELQEGKE